jgi:hypothetical protein
LLDVALADDIVLRLSVALTAQVPFQRAPNIVASPNVSHTSVEPESWKFKAVSILNFPGARLGIAPIDAPPGGPDDRLRRHDDVPQEQ